MHKFIHFSIHGIASELFIEMKQKKMIYAYCRFHPNEIRQIILNLFAEQNGSEMLPKIHYFHAI